MEIGVFATNEQWQELTGYHNQPIYHRIKSWHEPLTTNCIILLKETPAESLPNIQVPVFVNDVVNTLREQNRPSNFLRINGWSGFLKRKTWELAGEVNDEVEKVLEAMEINRVVVPDSHGMVTATVIAMIVNEAYFALEDEVSTKQAIDIAMKLGTGYPYGPFEWSEMIGIKNIDALLTKLSQGHQRYKPAPLLKAAANT